MKDQSTSNVYEMSTSILGLSLLSAMDMVNCGAPNALNRSMTTVGLAISTTMLAISFLMEAFTGNWTDALEIGMQLLNSNFKLVGQIFLL